MSGKAWADKEKTARIVPPAPVLPAQDQESLDVWGFKDTRFQIRENASVVLTGNRYELCGQELPHLVPWVSQVIQIPIDPRDVHAPAYPPVVPDPIRHPGFLTEIKTFL